MLRSMTGYGKASVSSPLGHFSLEIQSVNRKFLEINLTIPKELSFLTVEIRKILESEITCGQVNVNLRARFEDKLPFKVLPNLALAKEIYLALTEISTELPLSDQKNISLSTLIGERPDLLLFESQPTNEEHYRSLILDLTKNALNNFLAMRELEGKALVVDFSDRVDKLEKMMQEVASIASKEPEKLKEKLLNRLQESFPNALDNEDRMLRELVIYCEKCDIQEEITRFFSHTKQFRSLLEGRAGGIGKKMDFLSQEIARELNTLGAKSTDLQITGHVVEMKTELSRIREQLQNVE